MKRVIRNEDAFTGLEAAIVLIAFVVVAAVFSYVVLGAGFFTTQKSQEVVHSGVTQAASNIVVKGEVYGIADDKDSPTKVNFLRFDIGLAAGGLPIDLSKAAFTISTESNVTSLTKTSANPPQGNTWAITEWPQDDGSTDDILKSEETVTVLVNTSGMWMEPRTAFNLELKPEIGASLGVQRTVPPSLTNVTLLY